MSEDRLYQGGGYEVTHTFLRTPRASHDLTSIRSVALRRTVLLVALLPSVAVLGFVVMLHRYLTASEIVTLTSGAIGALIVSGLTGTLHVESVALRDGEIGTTHGLYFRLKRVRAAIERTMRERDTAK